MHPLKRRIRAWRKNNERYRPDFTVPAFKLGYKLVLVWAGFSARGRISLFHIDGRFNQVIYREVVDSIFLPFMNAVHQSANNFIL